MELCKPPQHTINAVMTSGFQPRCCQNDFDYHATSEHSILKLTQLEIFQIETTSNEWLSVCSPVRSPSSPRQGSKIEGEKKMVETTMANNSDLSMVVVCLVATWGVEIVVLQGDVSLVTSLSRV
jgi:hypothetical protein